MMLELSCNLPVIGVCREENPYPATCTGYRYMLISLALKFCKFLVYLATRSHRQVMFGRPARVPLTDDRWTFIPVTSMDLSLRTFGAPGIADF